MRNYILLVSALILIFFVGCSWSEINPLPQDYNLK